MSNFILLISLMIARAAMGCETQPSCSDGMCFTDCIHSEIEEYGEAEYSSRGIKVHIRPTFYKLIADGNRNTGFASIFNNCKKVAACCDIPYNEDDLTLQCGEPFTEFDDLTVVFTMKGEMHSNALMKVGKKRVVITEDPLKHIETCDTNAPEKQKDCCIQMNENQTIVDIVGEGCYEHATALEDRKFCNFQFKDNFFKLHEVMETKPHGYKVILNGFGPLKNNFSTILDKRRGVVVTCDENESGFRKRESLPRDGYRWCWRMRHQMNLDPVCDPDKSVIEDILWVYILIAVIGCIILVLSTIIFVRIFKRTQFFRPLKKNLPFDQGILEMMKEKENQKDEESFDETVDNLTVFPTKQKATSNRYVPDPTVARKNIVDATLDNEKHQINRAEECVVDKEPTPNVGAENVRNIFDTSSTDSNFQNVVLSYQLKPAANFDVNDMSATAGLGLYISKQVVQSKNQCGSNDSVDLPMDYAKYISKPNSVDCTNHYEDCYPNNKVLKQSDDVFAIQCV